MSIFIAAIIFYFLISTWFIRGFMKKQSSMNSNTPFVSVIVAAHNEEDTIERCLQALLHQDYPKENYEVIIVNDRSTDDTETVIQQCTQILDNFKSVTIDKTPPGFIPKRYALQRGIQSSSGEILCFTDADCFPQKSWLRSMISVFSDNVGMVAGMVVLIPPNTKTTTPLWQRFRIYESWVNSFVASTSIKNNIPLTCFGGSMAYRKSLFQELQGFQSISHSLSGDDDLFMHQVRKQTSYRIAAVTEPDAMVATEISQSFKELWYQRQRHFSASKYYPVGIQLIYAVYHGISLLCTLAPVIALFTPLLSFTAGVAILLFKWLIDFAFHSIGFILQEKRIVLKDFFLFELFYPLYLIVFGLNGWLKKPVWKVP